MTTDVGTLSAGEVVTDSAGNGSVTFTAPSVNTPASSASILAVPVGENLDNARGQIVTVALLGPDVPEPAFTAAPTTPAVFDVVTF